ncbi:neocarzinostatin apoprotein domain-containing protein [Streptomyces sp. NPDC097619]|uniref:neocarzinostatin apoprotein domain-containing protein n=1 Tax=Streptomyces sp. NPDC097619 TaxID=3157228 RepID=UPI0033243FD3
MLAAVLLPIAAGPAGASPAAEPAVRLSLDEVAKGTEITVSGTGWRPAALLTLLVCGQNMIGGTNSCANADGRVVTTDATGRFGKQLPVAAPPKPCPCVVAVATVTGERAQVLAPLKITGHPEAALPTDTGTARLAVLAAARLDGGDGILTWFGAPPSRKLVVTLGNLGTAPVKDPLFQVGTAHGVFAPVWEERQWRGTLPPGGKARVELPVELTAGAHGDYAVSVKYGEKLLVVQPWGVDRPYGVVLFWALLCLVVPAAVFRVGMAVVDRVRPAAGPGGRHRGAPRLPEAAAAVTARLPRRPAAPRREPSPPVPARRPGPTGGGAAGPDGSALPWFSPDRAPGTAPGAPPGSTPVEGAAPQTSAPSENSPTTKGHA